MEVSLGDRESKCPKIGGSKCPRANVRNKREQMSQNRGSKCPESKCYTTLSTTKKHPG